MGPLSADSHCHVTRTAASPRPRPFALSRFFLSDTGSRPSAGLSQPPLGAYPEVSNSPTARQIWTDSRKQPPNLRSRLHAGLCQRKNRQDYRSVPGRLQSLTPMLSVHKRNNRSNLHRCSDLTSTFI